MASSGAFVRCPFGEHSSHVQALTIVSIQQPPEGAVEHSLLHGTRVASIMEVVVHMLIVRQKNSFLRKSSIRSMLGPFLAPSPC